jgi:hypothetical protein
MNNNELRKPEQPIVISVDAVDHLSKFSGFLTISSKDVNCYKGIDIAGFHAPKLGWVPPYPYYPAEVHFSADD